MEFLKMGIIIIIAILLIFCVYRIADLSSKLNRIRNRYDKMLRGNSDINIEELLTEQGEYILKTEEKMKKLEGISSNFYGEVEKNSSSLSKKFNDKINDIDSRLAKLEENKDSKFGVVSKKMEASLDNMKKVIENKYNQSVSDANSELRKFEESQNNIINNLVKKNEDFSQKLKEDTENSIRHIADKVAFAIQKVSINRYNALSNQSGNLSFTIVLLDQFNNGIILTCINGRDSSYTYSKEVKNGKSVQDCSPEEEEALNKIINK